MHKPTAIPVSISHQSIRALTQGLQAQTLRASGEGDPVGFAVPQVSAAQNPRSVQRVPRSDQTVVVHIPPQGPAVPANRSSETTGSPAPAREASTPPKTETAAPAPPSQTKVQPPSTQRPSTVQQAIASAAERTSVDYDYLIAQAELESGLNPRAKARTSTATGLFQFLENTWLGTMKRHGARFGFANIADQIQTTGSGRITVPDRGQRNAILALRNDPEIASLMAAGLAEDNREQLVPVLGRQPDHGELYLAHFLGAGGARQFLRALQSNPGQSAASVFPRPAAANRPIFYQKNGQPRSLAGVMELIDSKMRRALARVGEPGMNARANAPIGPRMAVATTFAPSPPAGALTSATFTPPPYVIADEAVFEPGNPPTITGGDRARFAPASVTAGLPTSAPASRFAPAPISMSAMLRATFGGDGAPALASPEGAAQVKRAYDQLKALGL